MSSDPLQSKLCAERLKALSEPIRLRIVQTLRAGPRTVGDLSQELELDIATVSHHLGILHNATLVERQRRGRFIDYRLTAEVFKPAETKAGPEHLDLGCCRLEIPTESPPQ